MQASRNSTSTPIKYSHLYSLFTQPKNRYRDCLNVNWLERLRIRHTLRHHPIPREVWANLLRTEPVFKRLNGSANGMPPLRRNMVREPWTQSLSQAFELLQRQLAHHHPGINAYGATNPAEFFAVISEYFFTDPEALHHLASAVYDQLVLFYGQDPLPLRIPHGSLY